MTKQSKESTIVENPLPQYQPADKSDFIDLSTSALYDYCEEAIKQFGYLDNQGLALDDEDGDSGPVYIDTLYVLPKASEARIAPEHLAQLERDGKNEEDETLFSIANLIWENPRLTLLGDPGVGKTTLVQWLVCSLCHRSKNYAQQQMGPLFPLVLTARKIPLAMINRPMDSHQFVTAILTTQADVLGKQILDNTKAMQTLYDLLACGQVILLVDGLDEISTEVSLWLQQQIRQLLADFAKVRLLSTSRVVGFSAREFWQMRTCFDTKSKGILATFDEQDINREANLPTSFYLAPFQPDQRQQFANNWLENYLPPSQDKRDAFIKGIAAVSEHSLQLNALSRIPVLLNLICFILWRRGKLPDGRAELYQDIVKTYLVTMDKVREIDHNLSDAYDYQDIKNWLAKLALQMQAGNLVLADEPLSSMDEDSFDEDILDEWRATTPTIAEERLLQVSEQQLTDFLQLQLTEVVAVDQLRDHSRLLIDYIKHRTGFLIPKGQIDGQEYYGFSHLSFQEYFAAYAISKLPRLDDPKESFIQSLLKTTQQPAWGEIWQLVFEELSLSGKSRREIERLVQNFFEDPANPALFEDSHQNIPENISLYSKIIMNPAIKIGLNKREHWQQALVASYVSNKCNNKTLDALVNHLLRNTASFIFALKDIEALNLFDKKLNDYDWIKQLSCLGKLKKLALYQVEMGDFDWLRQCSNIESIGLMSCDFVDVAPLVNLKSINTLWLYDCPVTDISQLIECNSLKLLTLSGTKITDFKPLGHLTKLAELYLRQTNIRDINPLIKLKQLVVLDIQHTKIADLSPLLALTALKTLVVSEAGMKSNAVIKQLQERGVFVPGL